MISIVLPAYNEADRIEKAVERIKEELKTDFEIIIAEDGSTDGTDAISSQLSKKYSEVRHLHSPERLGRGKALKNAFEVADGEILVYMDVDLSTDLSHLDELIRYAGENDVVTGSRMLPESIAERSLGRKIATSAYNSLVRIILRSKIRDHQCGFKAFRKESILPLLKITKSSHWFWDTEILIRSQRNGLKVKEFPVRWRESRETKVKMKDILWMGFGILRLWVELLSMKAKIVLSSLLAFLIILLLLLKIGIQEVFASFYLLNFSMLAVACFIYLLEWPLRGLRYRSILFAIDYRERTSFLTGSIFLSQTANVLLPARIGDLARAYILKRKRGIPYRSGLSSLASERIFDLFAITLLAIICSVLILKELPGEIVYSLILSSFLIVAVFLFLLFLPSFGSSRFSEWLSRFFQEVKISFSRSFFPVLGFTLLIWFLEALTTFFVLHSFRVMLPFHFVFIGVAFGTILKTFPLTPGGIGLYEGALLLTFFFAGVSPAISGAVAIIDHFIKNMLTVIPGIFFLYYFNLRISEIVK
jgi:hypothetical protein